MIEINVDRREVFRREIVSKMSPVPYHEEAASLLMGAALLWQGPLGVGRRRTQELRQLAGRAYAAGHSWRACALNRLPEGDRCRLLFEYRDCRCYEAAVKGSNPAKHPAAANRLVMAAAGLLQKELLIIAADSQLYLPGTAEVWENLLEELGEHPAAALDLQPVPDEAFGRLELRAVCRAGESLCRSAEAIWRSAHSLTETETGVRAGVWARRAEIFRVKAEACFEEFADIITVVSLEKRQALVAARDLSRTACWPDGEYWHLRPYDEVDEVSALVEDIVAAFLATAGVGNGAEAEEIAKSADLPLPATKALPTPV